MPQKLYLEVKNMRKKTFGGSIRNRTRDREINHLNRGINDMNVNSSTLGLHMSKYKMNDAPRFLSNGDKFNDLKNIKFNNPGQKPLIKSQDKRIKFII